MNCKEIDDILKDLYEKAFADGFEAGVKSVLILVNDNIPIDKIPTITANALLILGLNKKR